MKESYAGPSLYHCGKISLLAACSASTRIWCLVVTFDRLSQNAGLICGLNLTAWQLFSLHTDYIKCLSQCYRTIIAAVRVTIDRSIFLSEVSRILIWVVTLWFGSSFLHSLPSFFDVVLDLVSVVSQSSVQWFCYELLLRVDYLRESWLCYLLNSEASCEAELLARVADVSSDWCLMEIGSDRCWRPPPLTMAVIINLIVDEFLLSQSVHP